MSLSIGTTKSFTGEVEISPRGEIDVDTAHEVREAVAAVMKDNPPTQINLNLRHVSFIDSVGISALVAGFQAAKVGGVKLIVTQPSRFVHRQLWVTGLLGLFGAPEPADGPSLISSAEPAVVREAAVVREPAAVRESAGFGEPVVLREPAAVADGLT